MASMLRSVRVATTLIRPQPSLRLVLNRSYAVKTGQFYFTKDHEWVKLDANNVATVGITDHAQHALGDVVFVEVPEKGKTVKQKATLAAVESVKAASDIYAPISGKVIEGNEALGKDPAIINKSPEQDGWICKLQVEPSNLKELDTLLDKAAYDKHCKDTAH
eukprot:Phypoly_transcript_24802.p1 GENE.Phypoly_transcript_24802~~Phypoly_transcript_24802.p1  ORF type:complete len:162 (+),score=37.85 Phypoly_transcript_24802:51-536(+)